ncbi:MAG: hypothetical protein JWP40_4793 [Blastococcus sp.]|nr:hypothetical protein [Blastococcus sp.]
MCELLAVAWERPVPFEALVERTCRLEQWGIAGFGWGVAWQDTTGRVRVDRGLGRFQDEAPGRAALRSATGTRFLVHLRRPNRLSTVQLADTQPFPDGDHRAFCHNGYLERAEAHRPVYAGVLSGAADSEVGWAYLREQLLAGMGPEAGLAAVDETFGGTANLGYLDATGALLIYSRNPMNPMWNFGVVSEGIAGDVVATSLHSADETVFDVVFPDAVGRRLLPPATTMRVDATADRERHQDCSHPTAVPHVG